jgi:uncharacterized protein
MISMGADVHYLLNEEESMLIYAIKHGQLSICEILIDNKVDINRINNLGKTALHYAAEFNSIEICQLLLDHEAMIIYDHENNSPLFHLVQYGQESLCDQLLKQGANPLIRNHDEWSALSIAMFCGQKNIVHLLEEWIEKENNNNNNNNNQIK